MWQVAPSGLPVSGWVDGTASCRETRLLQHFETPRGDGCLRSMPRPLPQVRIGGVCQVCPQAALTYPCCYTHRVATLNHRLVSSDANMITFRWKDYCIKNGSRQKVMHLATPGFICRFLIHVLPDGFCRIQHYGFLGSGVRKTNLARIRTLLCAQPPDQTEVEDAEPDDAPLTLREPCPCCGDKSLCSHSLRL